MSGGFASFDRLAGMFSALGGSARLRIVQLLFHAGSGGLSVNAIKLKVGIPGSTLSHHLDRLKRHDVLVVERQGTILRYSLNPKALEQLARFLLPERHVPTSSRTFHVGHGPRPQAHNPTRHLDLV